MENKQDDILAFDTLFTNNHICMMKLLLPTLPPSRQRIFAVYIKYLELQYTLQYFARHPGNIYPSSPTDKDFPDFAVLYERLLPYCTPPEKERFTQLHHMLKGFQNMQEMLEMITMLKEVFPEIFATCDNGDSPNASFANLSPDIMAGLGNLFQNNEGSATPGNMDMEQIMNLLQMLRGGT